MKKKAHILGATGQDGSYMVDLLLKKNYQVHGLYRKSSVGNTQNIDHLISDNKIFNKKFFLHKGDLLDTVSLNNIINEIKTNEIYKFPNYPNATAMLDGVMKYLHIHFKLPHYQLLKF